MDDSRPFSDGVPKSVVVSLQKESEIRRATILNIFSPYLGDMGLHLIREREETEKMEERGIEKEPEIEIDRENCRDIKYIPKLASVGRVPLVQTIVWSFSQKLTSAAEREGNYSVSQLFAPSLKNTCRSCCDLTQ